MTINPHRRLSYFWPLLVLGLIAVVLWLCALYPAWKVISSDKSYGGASVEHGRLHAYHGTLYSYWDAERFRWSFDREGVCKL